MRTSESGDETSGNSGRMAFHYITHVLRFLAL